MQKNVETLRSSAETIRRRDREAWLEFNDRDVEFRGDPEWPEAVVVRGQEAVWDTIIGIVDAWEQNPTNIVEVIDAGQDRLVARFKQPVRGKASGVETEFDYWWVGTFRGGKILSNWWFSDRAKALEAAGVSDPAQERRGRCARWPAGQPRT